MKKAMDALLISGDGEVFTKASYRLRHYPRTKWVVRAERQFRRKWLEFKREDEQLKALRFSNYEKVQVEKDA